MKRVLFFPSYFGGFGHVARCLLLAEELVQQDWSVAMILAGPYADAVKKAGFEVLKPLFPLRLKRKKANSPDYLWIPDASVQVLRDGFTRPWQVRAAVLEAMHFVRGFRPDVLIGDFSLLTWMIGQRAGIPVVQVVQSFMHPETPGLIWWRDPPSGISSPNIRPVFDPVLEHWKLNPIRKVEDLFRGDLFLIPCLPELDPLPEGITNTYYVGPLVPHSHKVELLPEPLLRPRNERTVYVTMGGDTVGHLTLLRKIIEAFHGTRWCVIISTGQRSNPAELGSLSPNIHCFSWVPGPSVIERSDAVLFHGGHVTMMETVRHGVPSVVVPSHSEREANGRRLEACSASRVLSPTSLGEPIQLIRKKWTYGEFTLGVQSFSTLTPEILREAVADVLENSRYREGVIKLRDIASHYQGLSAAADLIRNVL